MKRKLCMLFVMLFVFLAGCGKKEDFKIYTTENEYIKITNIGGEDYRLTGNDACYIIYKDILLGKILFSGIKVYNDIVNLSQTSPDLMKSLDIKVRDDFTYHLFQDFTVEGESIIVSCLFDDNSSLVANLYVETRDLSVVEDVLSLFTIDILTSAEYEEVKEDIKDSAN